MDHKKYEVYSLIMRMHQKKINKQTDEKLMKWKIFFKNIKKKVLTKPTSCQKFYFYFYIYVKC